MRRLRALVWLTCTCLFAGCGGGGSGSGGVAPGSGDGGSGSGVPAAPVGLSYQTPQTLYSSTPVVLKSTVTGTVTTYSVSPSLPAGLTLDPMTGDITGRPLDRSAPAVYTITASNAAGS